MSLQSAIIHPYSCYLFQLGTEILGMTAAEIRNPTKNIPRAIRGVWVRILVFYILGVFVRTRTYFVIIFFLNPPLDPRSHLCIQQSRHSDVRRNCCIVGMGRCHQASQDQGPTQYRQRVFTQYEYISLYLCIILTFTPPAASAWSAGSSDLYTSSRAMYGLAKTGQAPRIFARTNKRGTPWVSLLLSTAVRLLALLAHPIANITLP